MASWTTIDHLGLDLLQNIITRLPAFSFASANCVSRSWNRVCGLVLCRPKLSSACSFNPSLQVAVEDVVNKVLSEPIRPHFAIASVRSLLNLEEAHKLITAKLGSKVPIITSFPDGIFGRDAISNEFKETRWGGENADGEFMLTVGFVPGLKVKIISIFHQIGNQLAFMTDNFIKDIWDFSTSVSGRRSPAAIMIFSEANLGTNVVMEKLDYAMSPETVIVGDCCCFFRDTNRFFKNTTGSALVFVEDRNKPPGIGETQFHAVLSSGLLPIGPTYTVASVKKKDALYTGITARREGSREILDSLTLMDHAVEERGDRDAQCLYFGVTKRRKHYIGQEKVGWMTSLAFHEVLEPTEGVKHLFVDGTNIKRGDTFRFYIPNSTAALSSLANVSNHLRSFKQGCTGDEKREVFGGYIFTSYTRADAFFGQPNLECSPFLDNFPGVTFGGTYCLVEIGCGDLTSYVEESQENSVRFVCRDTVLSISSCLTLR